MLNGQLLIDFHVHLPQYAERTNSALEWFRSHCPSPEVYDAVSQTCADPANFTAMLERKGVDYAVLLAEMTPSVSGIVSNETIAAFCRSSDKLIPFCTFDPHRGGDLAAELHRLAGMGFRGVKLYPTYNYFYPNDAALYPLYGAAQELGMPVMYHTGLSVFQNSRIKYGNPIFLDDVAVDFPDLTLVMSHGGRGPWYDEAMTMLRIHKNAYIDITGLPPKKLLQYFPDLPRFADKFLFGTDWPSVDMRRNAEAVAALPLPPEAIRGILGETAKKLLHL